jgi:hypothetical protein
MKGHPTGAANTVMLCTLVISSSTPPAVHIVDQSEHTELLHCEVWNQAEVDLVAQQLLQGAAGLQA